MTGDPAAGGRLDRVSGITGIAFGRPWCTDPAGVLEGTATCAPSAPVAFHGTLELMAVLERAVLADPVGDEPRSSSL